jgi:hypothetical protein
MVVGVELVEVVVVLVVIKEVVVVAVEEVVQRSGGPQANAATMDSGPQVNAATTEEAPSLTLTGEKVKQWEQWQKIKTSEISKTTSVGPAIATTSHFGNFANYAHLGKGTQE